MKKDNKMKNIKQADNKEDHLSQFDLELLQVEVLFMEPPYQGKTRQSKRLCTKKA